MLILLTKKAVCRIYVSESFLGVFWNCSCLSLAYGYEIPTVLFISQYLLYMLKIVKKVFQWVINDRSRYWCALSKLGKTLLIPNYFKDMRTHKISFPWSNTGFCPKNSFKLAPKQHQSVIFTKICNIHLCYIKVSKHISNTTYIRTDFFRGIFKTT